MTKRKKGKMAKVYGVHEFEVNPGADIEQMKEIIALMNQAYKEIGWNLSLIKGDRGEREGKYALLVEIESQEARDQIEPESGQYSEVGQRWLERHKDLLARWDQVWAKFSQTENTVFTDYYKLV